jgi:hypothetical protein
LAVSLSVFTEFNTPQEAGFPVEGPASFWVNGLLQLREIFPSDSPAAIRGLTGGPPGLTGWFGRFTGWRIIEQLMQYC